MVVSPWMRNGRSGNHTIYIHDNLIESNMWIDACTNTSSAPALEWTFTRRASRFSRQESAAKATNQSHYPLVN